MEGDLDPILRAEFPAAVRSARGRQHGRARAPARARGSGEEGEGEENLSEGFDMPLYYSTICEESVFPWNRSSSPQSAPGRSPCRAARTAGKRVCAVHTGQRARAERRGPLCLMAVCLGRTRSRRSAIPERADLDPERRRRSAHADRERTRGGGPDTRRATAGRAQHGPLRARRGPDPLRTQRPASAVRGQAGPTVQRPDTARAGFAYAAAATEPDRSAAHTGRSRQGGAHGRCGRLDARGLRAGSCS